jgi:hypothetical protein
MCCQQYPTETRGRGNRAVGSSWDNGASPNRWYAARQSPRPTASPQAVGSKGGMPWPTDVHRC